MFSAWVKHTISSKPLHMYLQDTHFTENKTREQGLTQGHSEAEADLEIETMSPGFQPPLTHPLDRTSHLLHPF